MAKIYVGTYHKYNCGSIAGAWVDLDIYNTQELFGEKIKELHKDEEDPEYMFQDYEGFPDSFYSESSLDSRLWDWLLLDEDEQQIVEAYLDNVDVNAEIRTALDCYLGTADSKEDWAEQYLEDTGQLERVPQNLRCYFDFASFARDLEYDGFTFVSNNDHTVSVFHDC